MQNLRELGAARRLTRSPDGLVLGFPFRVFPFRGFPFRGLSGVFLGLLLACGGTTDEHQPASASLPATASIDPPAGPGAMAPGVAAGRDGTHLVWLEPLPEGGHRLLASILRQDDPADNLEENPWRAPVEIARGDRFFANWADTPAVVEAADGTLYAHWLEKLGTGTYAYGVQIALSHDGGSTWQRAGWLQDDLSETEHGFVALAASPDSADTAGGPEVEAVWLDGRGTASGGAMQLRAARLDGAEIAASSQVAASVCDCCPTAMAVAAAGPVVTFRGRTKEEVRDIHLARRTVDGWQAPVLVHADDWTIAGCPVNGPAVAAAGEVVSVAWFTAAQGAARVQVAISRDGGASFGPPLLVDDEGPIGRVAIAMANDQVFVTWIGRRADSDGAEIRMARVDEAGGFTVEALATTLPARSAGVPRLIRDGGRLLLAWVEASEPSVLRVTAIRI